MSTVPPPSRQLALIAEDEPLIMMETADLLEDRGFAVLEAYRAEKALQQLAAHPEIALLVTDVQMPGTMNGVALAHEAHRLYPTLSIIICSGQLQPDEGELPMLAVFLDKPLSSQVLAKGLSRFKGLS